MIDAPILSKFGEYYRNILNVNIIFFVAYASWWYMFFVNAFEVTNSLKLILVAFVVFQTFEDLKI